MRQLEPLGFSTVCEVIHLGAGPKTMSIFFTISYFVVPAQWDGWGFLSFSALWIEFDYNNYVSTVGVAYKSAVICGTRLNWCVYMCVCVWFLGI